MVIFLQVLVITPFPSLFPVSHQPNLGSSCVTQIASRCFLFSPTVHPRMHAYLTPIKQHSIPAVHLNAWPASEERWRPPHGLARFSRWIINWPQCGRDPGHRGGATPRVVRCCLFVNNVAICAWLPPSVGYLIENNHRSCIITNNNSV